LGKTLKPKKKEDLNKRGVGRPLIEINLNEVAKLCKMQATRDEICSFLEVDECTLQRRIKEADFQNFEAFYKKYSEGGKISLRRSQWKSAKDGNVTMQIWLGKQYLGQKEKNEYEENQSRAIDMTIKFIEPDKKETK
jgi:hypothetical protein